MKILDESEMNADREELLMCGIANECDWYLSECLDWFSPAAGKVHAVYCENEASFVFGKKTLPLLDLSSK